MLSMGHGRHKKWKNKKQKKRDYYEARLEQQAENRRKLLAKLDRKTAEWVAQDFARLGLYQ